MALIKKKGTSGAVSNYISRRQALKKLQVSLKDFRRLCILKGIYPREPSNKKKVNKGSTAPTTWYYRRDIQFLQHEPLLQKFRDWKIFARKMARVMGKRNYSAAEALQAAAPKFTYDHIIRERYPTFTDAIRDLDDALSMIFLFASMPTTAGVKGDLIVQCQRKALEFQQYIVQSRSLRKTFISIKGIYYQAEIKGQEITWITPHQFSQQPPSDVDFKVMGTFLQLYETLLGFVLFKLYSDAGLKYPPNLDEALEKDAAGLAALHVESTESTGSADASAAVKAAPVVAAKKMTATEKKRMSTLKDKIATIGKGAAAAAAAATAALESSDDDEEETANDDDAAQAMDFDETSALATTEAGDLHSQPLVTYAQLTQSLSAQQSLFSNLTFFIPREVPRTALEFLVRSFGGRVGWDAVLGAGSPFAESDPRITHHLVDRPALSSAMKALPARSFVRPQWVFDCINAGKLLLVSGAKHGEGYAVGQTLPPHLSPFEARSDSAYDPTVNYSVEDDAALADSDDEEMVEGEDDDDEEADEEEADSSDDEEEEEEVVVAAKKGGNNKNKAATKAKVQQRKEEQEAADKEAMSKILMTKRNKTLYTGIKRREGREQAEKDKLKRKRAELDQQQQALASDHRAAKRARK
ncbi:Pescadillo N-terminus-domain-containing protein [Blastocladiella britannica]|nr:Pescadillo N-terminus-domain-containing protein [Blastocladiella britannica]